MTRAQFDKIVEEFPDLFMGEGEGADHASEALLHAYETNAFEKLDERPSMAALELWFKGLAQNVSRKEKRRQRIAISLEDLGGRPYETATPGSSPTAAQDLTSACEPPVPDRLRVYQDEGRARDVQKALAQFEEPLRSDLYDYLVGGVSLKDLAAERGEEYVAFQRRIHRAVVKLRESLRAYARRL